MLAIICFLHLILATVLLVVACKEKDSPRLGLGWLIATGSLFVGRLIVFMVRVCSSRLPVDGDCS